MANEKKGCCSKLEKILFHPKSFFNSIESEKKYSDIMFFYVKVSLILIIISLILTIVTLAIKTPSDLLIGTANAVFNSVFNFGVSFIYPFILASIVHLGVLILKGKQKYFNTYKIMTYSATIAIVYSALAQIITWAMTLVTSTNLNAAPETLLLDPSFIAIMLVYIVIMIIASVHMLYTGTLGLSKYQKISKTRAFFSIVLIPLIAFILFMIFVIWLGLSGV
jgi:hypothetical protein